MWRAVKLDELFDFKNGRSFKKTEWSETGLPIIRIQNLNDSDATFNYFEGDYDNAIEVNNGDLLFSWSGTVGSSFGAHIWDREKGVLNQHIFKLTKKQQIDTRYAFYCLKNITRLIEQSVVGAVGIRHVTKKTLVAFEIPLPPLAEQQRIVAKLDAAFAEIDRAVDSTKSKINEGSAIYKSMARKVFFENPNKVPISAVAEIIMGQSPKGDTYNSEGKGVPLINGPVEFERDDFGKSKSIKFTTAPTKFCEAGDTLLCVRGSTTGRMNIAREASCIGRGVAALRAHEYQPWISYFIQSSRGLIYSLGKGATFPNISSKQIGEIEIYNPSAAEKQSLVFKLDKARIEKDNLIRLSESKLAQLASLKSAILAQELQPPQSEAA